MQAKRNIRLHVLSRHPLYQRGLTVGLGRCSRLCLAGSSSQPSEVLGTRNFDMLLTDLSSPLSEELALIGSIKQIPGVKVVLLGSLEQAKDIFRAMAAGSDAYIAKSLSLDAIAGALADVALGKPLPADPLLDARVWEQDDEGRLPAGLVYNRLNETEQNVLMMLSRGDTNREIAFRLGVSERTVRRYLSSVFRKIGVRNRVQAISRTLSE